jgi:hypothetical protein
VTEFARAAPLACGAVFFSHARYNADTVPVVDFGPPRDLYFLLLIGSLILVGSLLALLGDFGFLPSYFTGPIVPVLALVAVGALFLGGAAYLYWTRSQKGDHPFRPWRDY